MEPLDPRFARAHFEAEADPHRLSRDLERELLRRLVESQHPEQTAYWLLAALRALGHDVYSFDEDGEGRHVWTDNWAQQGGERQLTIELHVVPSEPASVRVMFVPRPTGRGERHCPVCNTAMQPTSVRFGAEGHGSATAPSVPVDKYRRSTVRSGVQRGGAGHG